MYFYSTAEQTRYHLDSLQRYKGVIDYQDAVSKGFLPLDMSYPDYNPDLQYCEDSGTIVDTENGTAKVNWVVKNLPMEVIEANLVKKYTKLVEDYMDRVARGKNYDDRKSCALRAGFNGPYQQEGIQFASWMDTCFNNLYIYLNKVKNGEKPIPTGFNDVLAELPDPPWEPAPLPNNNPFGIPTP